MLEHWEGQRPFRQIARWMTRHGAPVSPGTLCDRLGDLSAVVRTAVGGDSRPLGHGAGLAGRRDLVAGAATTARWRVRARLALGGSKPRRGLVSHRCAAQPRSGVDGVRGRPSRCRVAQRPVQQLCRAGRRTRPRARVLLGICCGPDYVAESRHRRTGHEDPCFVRNITCFNHSAPRKAISPLFSFHGRSGPGSAASQSAIALAFVSRSISA